MPKALFREIMTVPVISTGHIEQWERDRLDEVARSPDAHAMFPHAGGYGWILFIPRDMNVATYCKEQGYSEALTAILLATAEAGYWWLRLDSDGPELPAFPTFD